ncbi:MAG: SUMF1/EgtB/PvdO family nonheme iron enzyme, partial [Bacteroidales bacterium]
PTEVEWEFASLGLIGNAIYERIIERRLYPWNGHVMRTDMDRNFGGFVANFKRGRGDNMGVAGSLNDAADIPAPVFSYWPNDYGLYNMSGNVAEWVMDVYRPLSPEDVSDFNPYRGNVFMTKVIDDEGNIAEKDSLGRINWRDVTKEEAAGRRNYRQADNINYIDGDFTSSIATDWFGTPTDSLNPSKDMYDYSVTSMINDKVRVYKGGSWNDRAYYLVAGTRRFLDQSLATNYLGFRCAMTRVGSPIGGR